MDTAMNTGNANVAVPENPDMKTMMAEFPDEILDILAPLIEAAIECDALQVFKHEY